MRNIWDLPEQRHPIHGRRANRHIPVKSEQYEEKEPDIAEQTNKLMKTTSDFMLGAAGITVMAGMGGALLSALKPK